MDMDDKEYLNKLLNRALKSVPFVKLDAVEEVTQLFQEAVDVLEANIDGEIIQPNIDQNNPSAFTVIDPTSTVAASLSSLISSTISDNETKTDTDDSAETDDKGGAEKEMKRIIPKQLLGLTVTRDYNSPRHSTRSLSLSGPAGQKPPPLPPAASTQQDNDGGVGKKQSSRGPSSRAGGASAIGSALRVGEKGTGSSGGGGNVGLSARGSNNSGKGLSSRASVTLNRRGDEAGSDGDNDADEENTSVARPLPNKLLARVGAGGSKEFPSPKMGGRQLGGGSGAPKSSMGGRFHGARSQSAIGASMLGLGGGKGRGGLHDDDLDNEDLIDTDDKEDQGEGQGGEQQPAEKDDNPTSLESLIDDDDLTKRPLSARASTPSSPVQEMDLLSKGKDRISKVKDEIQFPATASPKQKLSSLTLLNIAKDSANQSTGSVFPQSHDDLINPSPVPNYTGPTGTGPSSALSSMPTGILVKPLVNAIESLSSSRVQSPKPAWLRRLDSPESHHGKLMKAKANLHQLINRALANLPHMKPEAAAKIKAAFEKAVTKLEQSTTLQLQSKE